MMGSCAVLSKLLQSHNNYYSPDMNMNKPPIRKISGINVGRNNLFYFFESLIEPLTMVVTLLSLALYYEGRIPASIFATAVFLFSLTFPSGAKIKKGFWLIAFDVLWQWLIIAGLVISFGLLTRYITIYNTDMVIAWVLITPFAQIAVIMFFKCMTPWLIRLQGRAQSAVIVGLNEQGLHLADSIQDDSYRRVNILGFFEDRSPDRSPQNHAYPMLGQLTDVSTYVKTHVVKIIYIALPMTSHPRILKLLDDLKDTTASIYFVPDIFVTDLIQGRVENINGLPIVSVCETPFTGVDGMVKRTADILFSLIALILISPILLAIMLGVKLTSPGPVIFKQKRYGLDGKQIFVYKFRSMTVCENGETVTQATKNDTRITKLGAFLRKTSLDELPQFFNVLQGRMSVVGPRPHAVAHNEEYRKLIKGYMIRHKVKPGITGWAQVNGFRGETDTLEKMQQRVNYDLEYLRNWSPRLDMLIVAKTVWLTIVGQDSAY